MPKEYIVGAQAAGIPSVKEDQSLTRSKRKGRHTHSKNHHAEFAKTADRMKRRGKQAGNTILFVSSCPGLVNEGSVNKGGAKDLQ